jgi:hypothetical protein
MSTRKKLLGCACPEKHEETRRREAIREFCAMISIFSYAEPMYAERAVIETHYLCPNAEKGDSMTMYHVVDPVAHRVLRTSGDSKRIYATGATEGTGVTPMSTVSAVRSPLVAFCGQSRETVGGEVSIGLKQRVSPEGHTMTSFAALIARLASSVKRSPVGSSAVARDVAQLAACITFHSLSLA